MNTTLGLVAPVLIRIARIFARLGGICYLLFVLTAL